MKRKIYVVITAITLLFVANTSQAGFYMKQRPHQTVTETASTDAAPTVAPAATPEETAQPIMQAKHVKKQSLLSRMWHAMTAKHSAAIPQWAYILLSIFFLGWLAMGINQNFSGIEWVLCLILYILLWLPGFIYSLIKMGDFY